MPPIKLERRTLTDERLYDANFALAMVTQTLFVLANCLLAHYNRWITFLGGDVKTVGFVMGAGPIIGLLMRPWIGQWINRFGAKTVWGAGFVVFGLCALANLLIGDLGWPIYLLRSGLVLGPALVFASSLTYITQTYPTARRTEAIGTLGASGFLGMILGPFIGDLIVGIEDPTRQAFVYLFVGAAVSVIIPFVLLFLLRTPERRAEIGTSASIVDFARTVRQHFPGAIFFVLLAFGLSMTAPFAFLATYIDDVGLRFDVSWNVFGLSITSVSVVGMFFWCYAGLGVSVRMVLRRAPERWGRRKVLLLGMTLMGTGMFFYAFVTPENPWMLIVPALICGTGHALVFHTMSALSLETFPHDVRGTGSAFTLMMMDVGFIGGAPLLGLIAHAVGYGWMYTAIGVTCMFSVAVYTWSSIPVWRARAAERNRVGHDVRSPYSATADTEVVADTLRAPATEELEQKVSP